MGTVELNEDDAKYYPGLDDTPLRKSVPVSKWWSQMVFKHFETVLTRQKIVLGAANQDGGAHVDDKLSPAYEWLCKDGAIGHASGKTRTGKQWTRELKGAHFVALRQMAHELLTSPELLALA
jgi:hypothetical protein